MAQDQQLFVMQPQRSIREAYVEASSFLREQQVMEPESNTRLLLEWVLDLSGAAYYMALPDPFPADKREAWESAVNRKAQGEPAQYIIGEQEFYGELFHVNRSVLIPRPETELLVEAVVNLGHTLPSSENEKRPICVDIGTGSGAIALTIARLCPDWEVWASDISADALQVAQHNSRQQGTEIGWQQGNLLEPFAGKRVNIVVSNPPYIPDEDIAGLQPEVREHEPLTALAGGPDGLGPYRIMMSQLSLLANRPEMVAFELGQGQAPDVARMVREAGYEQIHIIKDLAGIERHVIGILT
ncbi:peptide chain release factor N(5)-glutamine methyltransferase [Paenibacillus sp. Z6-24]